jgi:ABC-type branched-subunit amino acid transport system ATPase component
MFEPAGSLALGQQRIVEIARALCSDPCLLLLDEPAAGLRYLEKQALAELLGKLRSEGMGILLVEHDMDFVMGWPTASSSWNLARRSPKACRKKSSAIPRCLKPTSAAWSKS